MAVTVHVDPTPRWQDVVDPTVAYVRYDRVADELVVYFGGAPVPKYSDPIDAPGSDDVMVMVGMNADRTSTGEVVGIHIYPFRAGALVDHPEWRALTEPNPPAEAVADFVADVAALYARHGFGAE